MAQKGTLSINSENIFPIIKKWMYSDQDIFVREEISNACDAITKLEKLSLIGEWTKPADYKGRVDVIVDSEHKTVTFQDNGIGMTAEEVEKYINQIAFSGASDTSASASTVSSWSQIRSTSTPCPISRMRRRFTGPATAVRNMR